MKKISFISGHFNLIHLGHLRLFMHAKKISNKLIVGLLHDDLVNSQLYNSVDKRFDELKKISYIDSVVIIEKSLEATLNQIRPDYVLKGYEHSNKINIEQKIISKWNGDLIFSSGDLSQNIFDKKLDNFDLSEKSRDEIYQYLNRHKIKIKDLNFTKKNISNIRGLIVGDIIIDEYKYTEAIGMSQEDVSLSVKPYKSDYYIGGAGVIANHLKNLGIKITLLSVLGSDKVGKMAINLLKKNKIENLITIDRSRQTTLKTRIKENNRTLLRINNFDQTPINLNIHKKILHEIENFSKKKLDFIIFSDFNNGCITESLVKDIVNICQKKDITTLADSQSSSQIGNLGKFKEVNFIFPTEYELRLMLNNQIDGLISLLSILKKTINVDNIILKLGKNGALAFFNKYKNQREDILPSFNLKPIEVSGAGDAFLSTFSLFYSLTKNKWIAFLMGNIGSSVKLSKKGNEAIKFNDLDILIKKL